jgi:hypothetical protein
MWCRWVTGKNIGKYLKISSISTRRLPETTAKKTKWKEYTSKSNYDMKHLISITRKLHNTCIKNISIGKAVFRNIQIKGRHHSSQKAVTLPTRRPTSTTTTTRRLDPLRPWHHLSQKAGTHLPTRRPTSTTTTTRRIDSLPTRPPTSTTTTTRRLDPLMPNMTATEQPADGTNDSDIMSDSSKRKSISNENIRDRNAKKAATASSSTRRRNSYWKGPANTLSSVKSYIPPPKIERTEDNYKSAIIKQESTDDGKVKKAIALIEQYEQDAPFLKTSLSFDDMEVMPSGDVVISGLNPGNKLHQKHRNTKSLQGNTKRSNMPQKSLESQIVSSLTPRLRATLIAKLSFIELPKISTATLAFSAHSRGPKNRSSSLLLILKIRSKSRLTVQQKPAQLSKEAMYSSLDINIEYLPRRTRHTASAAYANWITATKNNAAMYAAGTVAMNTTPMNATSPKQKKPASIVYAVELKGIGGNNAPFRIKQRSNKHVGMSEFKKNKRNIRVVKIPDIDQNRKNKRKSRQHNWKKSNYSALPRIPKRNRLRMPGKRRRIRKQRKLWFKARKEEAKDKIYRLPPPGNGPIKQTNITDFFRYTPEAPAASNYANANESSNSSQQSNRMTPRTITANILQWNACSLNEEKRLQLERLVLKEKIDIICISELGRYRKIKGFAQYEQCRRQTQSAIFWRNGMQIQAIKTAFNERHNDISTQCIYIANEVLLIHPYIAPRVSREDRKKYWNDVHAFCDAWTIKSPSCKILITGDLNTRDTRFGTGHSENHSYLDSILTNLEIISDRRVATRENNTLDVTLGNMSAKNAIKKWKAMDKLNSDHNPTKTEIELTNLLYGNRRFRQYKADTIYTVLDVKNTNKRIQTAIEKEDINEVTLIQINSILSSAAVYRNTQHKPIKFWTDKLKNAVRLQNRARKAIRIARTSNEDTSEPYRIYKRLANKFSKIFKKTKKQYRIKLIDKACQDPTGSGFFKIIKQIEPQLNKKTKPVNTENSGAEDDSNAEIIAEKFCKIFGQNDVNPTKAEKRILKDAMINIKREMESENSELFTLRELKQAVVRANQRSAKGPDGVSNRLIKLTCENKQFEQAFLQAINNQIITKGTYPVALKTAKIIPLPKPKRGEYRPISLLPSLSKIVEYMVQMRLREIVEPKLPRNQFGCRPGHSTTQALLRLMHYSGISAGTNHHFGAILYDFVKAYDRVPKHVIIQKMRALKIPAYLTNFVYQWLTDRKFTVEYKGQTSTPRKQRNGIPQGSSLSVLLWLLFMYDIPLRFDSYNANTYVDDTIGWAIAVEKEQVKQELRGQLKNMINWCTKNKVEINEEKTHVIFNESSPNDKVQYGNTTIRTTPCIKYLGAELIANKAEHKSTFLIRTEGVANQIKQRCRAIKALRKYKIPEQKFRQACLAFIGGKLNYFTPWLAAELAIKQTIRPLEAAYNEYMRTYTGCMATTPIPVLHAISRFPLLQDKILIDTAMTIIKAKAQSTVLAEDYEHWNGVAPEWTPFGSVDKMIKSRTKGIATGIHPQVITKPDILEKLSKCKFHLGNRETALALHKQGLLIPNSPDIAIWTDGSLQRDCEIIDCGAAATVHITNRDDPDSSEPVSPIITKLKIPNAVSSYETEIIALQAGLEALISQRPIDRNVHLFTDSLSCLQQLACLPYKYKYNNAVVADVAEKLATITDNNTVDLHFIPSHTDKIPESDTIDELAKEAAHDGEEIQHDPLISTFRLTFNKILRSRLNKYLRKNVNRSSFPGYPDRTPLITGYLRIKTRSGNIDIQIRNDHALLNRVRTGHSCARVHLKNVKIEKEGTCRLCGEEPETIEHQLIECVAMTEKLRNFRAIYEQRSITKFNQSLYDGHSGFMRKFLAKAKKHGCYI